ncbi:Slp family lipoprotein [Candidatus Methylacidiphilum fumarolicum]|nr:Slp family lipoprotein [Candidatus Methylacidiphilum fumarolicum]
MCKNIKVFFLVIFSGFVCFFSGCAPFTNVKMERLKKQPSFLNLTARPKRYKGKEVFLGGTVAAIKKSGKKTNLEIIELPLDESGKPAVDFPSEGRFIAEVSQEIDPTFFSVGTVVTLTGIVEGSAHGIIPEEGSLFPLIRTKRISPWKEPMTYGKNSTNWYDQPEGNLHAWGWGPGAYWW